MCPIRVFVANECRKSCSRAAGSVGPPAKPAASRISRNVFPAVERAIRVPRRATNTAVVFGAGNVRSRSRRYLRIAVIVVGRSGTRRDLPNFVSVTRTQPLPSPASSSMVMSSSLRFLASLIRIPVTVSSPSSVCQEAARTRGVSLPAATSSVSICWSVKIRGRGR